jgi:hypothetical protein
VEAAGRQRAACGGERCMLRVTGVMERPCAVARGIDINIRNNALFKQPAVVLNNE